MIDTHATGKSKSMFASSGLRFVLTNRFFYPDSIKRSSNLMKEPNMTSSEKNQKTANY